MTRNLGWNVVGTAVGLNCWTLDMLKETDYPQQAYELGKICNDMFRMMSLRKDNSMLSLKPDKDITVRRIKIKAADHNIPALVLTGKNQTDKIPCVLWIHGGGYILGMKEMV